MSIGFPQRGLISQNDAAMIQQMRVPRSVFNNRWTRKTVFDAGYLVPILVEEILPGDHMSYNITAYVRMSTPLYPMFDNLRVDTHIFYVPARILWANWVKFMGEQTSPADSINFTIPIVSTTTNGDAVGSLVDHMGVPVAGQITAGGFTNINVLPFRAYNLIFNTWFRDENITTAAFTSTGDGPDTIGNYNLLRHAKSHDYFTSALPWAQKFTPPTIPLGSTAPVRGIGKVNQVFGGPGGGPANLYESGATGPTTYNFFQGPIDGATANQQFYVRGTAASGFPDIYADLAATSGIAINTLRQAWMIQSLLENDARGGTRYVELIRNHFDVISPDFRLNRPEYIGGGQSNLTITPIAQTAPTAGVPLGAIGGAATAAGSHRASYAATEHGYIIGLISIKSELSYQQGLDKIWKRSTRFDFYWPELAALGEQAVLRQELYCIGDPLDFTVFGYQERWQEYRTRQSDVTGRMRSTAAGTLDMWHLAQRFTSPPVLNTTFIDDTPDMVRVLAAAAQSTGQQFLADIMYERRAVRPIPTYGTPALFGRF